eukprot:TRINITY_DN6239_c0_g1_i1.p1 TRINITY_DN6239_c0_g1~~TRINITY_DN6239_c0_g1_i1.p1  ORF type:complete len:636 (-),score=97.71 TRINITY_DN6239_c0_g1_i1:62-1969(-)
MPPKIDASDLVKAKARMFKRRNDGQVGPSNSLQASLQLLSEQTKSIMGLIHALSSRIENLEEMHHVITRRVDEMYRYIAVEVNFDDSIEDNIQIEINPDINIFELDDSEIRGILRNYQLPRDIRDLDRIYNGTVHGQLCKIFTMEDVQDDVIYRFILTFDYYTDQFSLLKLIIILYKGTILPITDKEYTQKLEKFRTGLIRFLGLWIDTRFQSIYGNEEWTYTFKSFLKGLDSSSKQVNILKTKWKVQKRYQANKAEIISSERISYSEIIAIDPELVAKTLTIAQCNSLKRIPLEEIIKREGSKYDMYMERNESCVLWIATTIAKSTGQDICKALGTWCDVILILIEYSNYSTLYQIYQAFKIPCILDTIDSIASKKENNSIEILYKIFEEGGMQAEKGKPFIPVVSLILDEYAVLEQTNEVYDGPYINYNGYINIIGNLLYEILLSHSIPYNFEYDEDLLVKLDNPKHLSIGEMSSMNNMQTIRRKRNLNLIPRKNRRSNPKGRRNKRSNSVNSHRSGTLKNFRRIIEKYNDMSHKSLTNFELWMETMQQSSLYNCLKDIIEFRKLQRNDKSLKRRSRHILISLETLNICDSETINLLKEMGNHPTIDLFDTCKEVVIERIENFYEEWKNETQH